MPALTTLTINDRATTPVAHPFTPMAREAPDKVKLREAAVVPMGDKTIVLTNKRLSDGSYVATVTIKVPVLATRVADGVTEYIVQRQSMADITLRFAASSVLQERKDLLSFVAECFAASKTVVNDAFMNLEGWT